MSIKKCFALNLLRMFKNEEVLDKITGRISKILDLFLMTDEQKRSSLKLSEFISGCFVLSGSKLYSQSIGSEISGTDGSNLLFILPLILKLLESSLQNYSFFQIFKVPQAVLKPLILSALIDGNYSSLYFLKKGPIFSLLAIMACVVAVKRQYLAKILSRNLTRTKIESADQAFEEAESEITRACPLCLSAVKSPSAIPCGHVFCWNCLYTSLKLRNECPICRFPSSASFMVLIR